DVGEDAQPPILDRHHVRHRLPRRRRQVEPRFEALQRLAQRQLDLPARPWSLVTQEPHYYLAIRLVRSCDNADLEWRAGLGVGGIEHLIHGRSSFQWRVAATSDYASFARRHGSGPRCLATPMLLHDFFGF